jgi:hypothetical protein
MKHKKRQQKHLPKTLKHHETQETPTTMTTQCNGSVGGRKQTHPLTREHFVHFAKPSFSLP